MRIFYILFVFLLHSLLAKSQQKIPDSLHLAFQLASTDSAKFVHARAIYTYYEETNRDSALHYARYRYELARKNGRAIEEAYLLGQLAYQQIYRGNLGDGLKHLTEAFQLIEHVKEAPVWELTPFPTPGSNRLVTLSMLNHMLGHLKLRSESDESAFYFKEGRRIGLEVGNAFRVTVADMVLGNYFLKQELEDSAWVYAVEGEKFAKSGGIIKYLANIYFVMGEVHRRKRNDSLALTYLDMSLHYAGAEENLTVAALCNESKLKYYLSKANADSMLEYGRRQLRVLHSMGAHTGLFSSENILSNAYASVAEGFSLKGQKDSANIYFRLALGVNDSLTSIKQERLIELQRITLDEQIRLQESEKERLSIENKRKIYLLLGGIGVALLIASLIYRNNRQKQKANLVLEKTLTELKSTQKQLIQSEKMASLGELTAGIAHEIQNPLNFVNNFSEVSTELIDEMKDELRKGDVQESLAIADDLQQNLEKINHHGKRADAIVKGMLEHSRAGSGERVPTDINALADEYLRLAYHGLRAKDKNFNADLQTNFDPSIGLVNIVPQDIGRVILNLINNAFYAVNERSKRSEAGYKPMVKVSTEKSGHNLGIRVEDNGDGVSESIKEKIFQPFFTTKPTGQGTGLGLSLAYDIVMAHGGKLTVEAKEGEGAIFTMQLSIG
jgi:signal transduction histidine kinase